ncbi:MAG: outer membrane protein [Phenylobacterium sp.]|jgi:outer membrane protein
MKLSIMAILLAATISTAASAQSQWGLGVGAIVSDKGYVDIGNESTVIPMVFYQSESFYLLGPKFGYKWLVFDDVNIDLVGQYRFDGYKEDDGDIFQGMEDRSGALDLGLSVDYKTAWGDLSFEYLTDATNEHKGNEMSLSYSKPYGSKSLQITPYVKVNRFSEDLVDYYYGVRANEETASRAVYIGEATTNIELGVKATWRVGKHHNFIGYTSYTAYGAEIEDSPLIDSSGNLSLLLGYMYVF